MVAKSLNHTRLSNRAAEGRHALRAWEDEKPKNFFKSDVNLQAVLRRYMGEDAFNNASDNFNALGVQTATMIDAAAKIEDRLGNHPRLERFNGLGERLEQIEFHPNHDRIGRLTWASGVMALQAKPGRTVEQMGLYYLIGHNGEGGHMCSLACTSGMIRALQRVADDALRERFLPPLLDPNFDTMQHAAQFLTEVQGGSDVGANAVTASQQADGSWRINGEKWFCSNINADQFLMTARPDGATEGTRGLGLFVVPRTLDDGSTNGFFMRRLKDKLGTRTLASAELDFVDAVAYPVGDTSRGFKNVVELVLNTSRLMNAVACAGIIRRAYIEAATYACQRQAFGQAIAHYPMVQEAIADLYSETLAATASSFYIAHLLDRIETGQSSEDERGLYRLLVNVNKYITSIRASEMVHRAIEVLGGNGAIESFSILPRLYRDVVVLESWEGTHNVLCVQVIRDMARYKLHEPFFKTMRRYLDGIHHEALRAHVAPMRAALAQLEAMLHRLQAGGDHFAQAHARRLVDHLAHIAQAILLLQEAQWEAQHDASNMSHKTDAIAHFMGRHGLVDVDPLTDEDYLPRLERLMMAI